MAVAGSRTIEAFLTNEEMEEKEYPDEHTGTFTIEKGQEEYYINHLRDLRHEIKENYGYAFDVMKLARALYHISRLDGFLNEDVMTSDTDGPGLGYEIHYRTDEAYPLRVRISENGWYMVAPCFDDEDKLREFREKEGENSG